jgi:hypothetical protein
MKARIKASIVEGSVLFWLAQGMCGLGIYVSVLLIAQEVVNPCPNYLEVGASMQFGVFCMILGRIMRIGH